VAMVRPRPGVKDWKWPEPMPDDELTRKLLTLVDLSTKKMPPHGYEPARLSTINGTNVARDIVQTLRIHPMSIIVGDSYYTVNHPDGFGWTEDFSYSELSDRFTDLICVKRRINPISGCGFPWDCIYENRGAFTKDLSDLWSVTYYTMMTIIEVIGVGWNHKSPFELWIDGVVDVISYFIKDEPMKLSKHLSQIWRGIKPASIRYYIIHLLLLNGWDERSSLKWKQSCTVSGLSIDPEGLDELWWMFNEMGELSGDDASKFENTVTQNDMWKYIIGMGHKFGKVKDEEVLRLDTNEEIMKFIFEESTSMWLKLFAFVEYHLMAFLVYIPNGMVIDRNYVGENASGKLTTANTNYHVRSYTQRTAQAVHLARVSGVPENKIYEWMMDHPESMRGQTLSMGDDIIHQTIGTGYMDVCKEMGKTITDYSNWNIDGYVDFISYRFFKGNSPRYEFTGREKCIISFAHKKRTVQQWEAIVKVCPDAFDWPFCPLDRPLDL